MKLPPHNPFLVVPTDGYLDPDLTNGQRARSARNALLHYQRERGLDSDETTCGVDLLTDLMHYLHALGEDPLQLLKKAGDYFIAETGGPESGSRANVPLQPEPGVLPRVGGRGDG